MGSVLFSGKLGSEAMRDMSKKQFDQAMRRLGFRIGTFGYVRVAIVPHVCCSILNGGSTRRGQLAYLLRERNKLIAENPSTFEPTTAEWLEEMDRGRAELAAHMATIGV